MRLFRSVLIAAVAFPSILVSNAFAPPASRIHGNDVNLRATVEKEAITIMETDVSAKDDSSAKPLFSNIMAANRAEIAVRIMRAATELNAGTVGIFVHEDRYSQHRWGADRSFLLEKEEGATPISAYLDIPQIIKIALENGVDAIHPGYGFLSESPEFAQACADAGITFVGPTVDNLNRFSDKTSAREAAIAAGVPVVPGSASSLNSKEEVASFVEEIGLPIIIKVRTMTRHSLLFKINVSNASIQTDTQRLPWEVVVRV
jgi:pyruvate carboxylase